MQKGLVNNQIQMYASVRCEHPLKVITRTGRTLFVGCGSCPACLAKRRNSWSFRLEQESKAKSCIHAFGFTFTYDSENVPYLPKLVLDSETYTYEQVDKQHAYIRVMRGCSPESIKLGENVPLLYYRDIQLTLKRFRKWLDKEFPSFFIRYFISPEYGETKGTTNRPHYHGIIYVHLKEYTELDASLLAYIAKCVEDKWLDLWLYCGRFYDSRKRIYVGKDIHKFGDSWGNYLGKYLNKVESAKYDTGSNYIPARAVCSRKSVKYGIGSLGSSWLYDDSVRYQRYMSELRDCKEHCKPFRPTYNENGYNKPLPAAFRNCLYADFFGVSISKVNKWIYLDNLKKAHPKRFYYFYETDENDPFQILKVLKRSFQYPVFKSVLYFAEKSERSCKMELMYSYVGLQPIQRVRHTRYSIYCPPAPPKQPISVSSLNCFQWSELVRIARYLSFRDSQTELYYSQFRVMECDRVLASCRLDAVSGKMVAHSRFIKPQFQKIVADSVQLRNEQLAKCAEIRKKAIDYKYKHQKQNHYA